MAKVSVKGINSTNAVSTTVAPRRSEKEGVLIFMKAPRRCFPLVRIRPDDSTSWWRRYAGWVRLILIREPNCLGAYYGVRGDKKRRQLNIAVRQRNGDLQLIQPVGRAGIELRSRVALRHVVNRHREATLIGDARIGQVVCHGRLHIGVSVDSRGSLAGAFACRITEDLIDLHNPADLQESD